MELGISDTKKIIVFIKDRFDVDFNEFSLYSLKRRFERAIPELGMKSVDSLFLKLGEDNKHFEAFIREVLVESTEMFRDPFFWKYLCTDIIPLHLAKKPSIHVWFPMLVSGDELFTLCLLGKEYGWIDKIKITATGFNQLIINHVKSGSMRANKVEISKENCLAAFDKDLVTKLIRMEEDIAIRDTEPIERVQFNKAGILIQSKPEKCDLVIYRNKILFYNIPLQEKVLECIHGAVASDAYLAIGHKEQLPASMRQKFKQVNKVENVYKKV